MKLGIFDSGLGGILIAKAIREHLPDIDMLYLGDTLHLPYGNRSEDAIYAYTKNCIEFLFDQDCNLIITACNTASASALRKLQQHYLPNSPYKDRRVLGVVVPTIEEAIDRGYTKLGLIGTTYTVSSNIYEIELQKINPEISLQSKNTPLLVPLIENDGEAWLDDVLKHYLKDFDDIETLLLGCTHYIHLKDRIRNLTNMDVISQDEIIPHKLETYLNNHPEISESISSNAEQTFVVTDLTEYLQNKASMMFGQDITLQAEKGVHAQ